MPALCVHRWTFWLFCATCGVIFMPPSSTRFTPGIFSAQQRGILLRRPGYVGNLLGNCEITKNAVQLSITALGGAKSTSRSQVLNFLRFLDSVC